jgi:uncharacterized protein YjbJ (UPF0337 family)
MVRLAGQNYISVAGSIEGEEKMTEEKSSKEDKGEGAVDKAKGRIKEAAGSLSGDEERKAEGRAEQDKGTLKEKKGKLKDLLK